MTATTGAVDAVRAHRAGRAAAQAGQPATACPYDPQADTAEVRVLAKMWLRGYDRANPMPVDYSG